MQDHPENDLHSATDRFNRTRPQPRTFDELADEPDPLALSRRNARATRNAIVYALVVVAVTLGVGLALASISRLQGGVLCDDSGTWLCTPTWRTVWAIATSIPPIAGLIGCAVIMVRKLNAYERWVPWMGVFWLPLVPFTMAWLILTVGILASDLS